MCILLIVCHIFLQLVLVQRITLHIVAGHFLILATFMSDQVAILCSSRKNPYPPQARSSEIPRGRGVLKAKILEAKYGAKLEFPWGEGGGGGKTKQASEGVSMDIFWNCTL